MTVMSTPLAGDTPSGMNNGLYNPYIVCKDNKSDVSFDRRI
jgi:hypothetical protein